jgi:hypothetical protein
MLPSGMITRIPVKPAEGLAALAEFARLADDNAALAELKAASAAIRHARTIVTRDHFRYALLMVELMRAVFILPYSVRVVIAEQWEWRSAGASSVRKRRKKNEAARGG